MPGDRFIELAQSEDRHVLDVLFRHAREAVTVQDQSGHLVYANDRAAELVGMASGAEMVAIPVDEIVFPFDMIDESGGPITVADLPARKVLAGLDAHEVTVGYRSHGSKAVRWARVNSSPIKDDAGRVVWAVNFFLDVTDQVRNREGERLLATVNEALAASVTIDDTLSSLAGLLAAELGSWCAIHIVDHRGDLALAASSTRIAKEPTVFEARDDPISLGSDRLQARVMKTGSAEVVTDPAGLIEDLTPLVGHQATLGDMRVRSVACVPLGSGTVAGTLTMVRDRSEPAFDSAELTLLRRVSGVATVALANARLFELEHETAEALRAGLTPSTLPDMEGFEVAARYVPLARFGHIGGDFFDIVKLSSRYAVVVGDIEGKGVPAASAVGIARDTMRATIKLEPRSEVVLSQLNDVLLEQNQLRMCTVAYLLVERTEAGAEALIALAGHPPPAVLTSDGVLSFPGTPCPPAGVLPSIQPHDTELSLSPGDTLFLYTDGFALPTEAPMETIARFVEGGQSEDLDHLLDRMLHDLSANMEVLRDDVLLLALRVT